MKHKIYVRAVGRSVLLCSEYPENKLLPYWSFQVKNWNWIKKKFEYFDYEEQKRKYRWDGKIKLLKRDRLPLGLFYATKREIEKREKIRFVWESSPHTDIKARKNKYWIKSENKYKFQNDCVDEMCKRLYKGGGLVLNATGSGKTRIAAMFSSRVACDILFVVDQLVLLDQARRDISEHLGEDVGKVGESKFKPKRVTVATIQTLFLHRNDPKFLRWFKNIKVIFIDEIHDQMNKSNFTIMEVAQPLVVYGLTATLGLSQKPVRLKAFSLAGPVIYEYPLKQGMAEGVLSKGIVIQLLYNNSIPEIRATDSSEAYVAKVVKNSERNYIIEQLVRRGLKKDKYIIVLVDRLKHLSRLSYRLEDVPHRIVAGTFRGVKIKVSERHKHKKKFESGKIRVILANKVFKKGVDIKRVDVIINASARKSKNDAIQILGRAARTHKDKTGFICIDISDFDPFDKQRNKFSKKKKEKKNWFAVAAKKRRRAYLASGITIRKFEWEVDGEEKELYRKANKWLNKELSQ